MARVVYTSRTIRILKVVNHVTSTVRQRLRITFFILFYFSKNTSRCPKTNNFATDNEKTDLNWGRTISIVSFKVCKAKWGNNIQTLGLILSRSFLHVVLHFWVPVSLSENTSPNAQREEKKKRTKWAEMSPRGDSLVQSIWPSNRKLPEENRKKKKKDLPRHRRAHVQNVHLDVWMRITTGHRTRKSKEEENQAN